MAAQRQGHFVWMRDLYRRLDRNRAEQPYTGSQRAVCSAWGFTPFRCPIRRKDLSGVEHQIFARRCVPGKDALRVAPVSPGVNARFVNYYASLYQIRNQYGARLRREFEPARVMGAR